MLGNPNSASLQKIKLRPLLESFVKAANEMPSLKKATLWSPLSWASDEEFLAEEDYLNDMDVYEREDCLDLAWGIVFVEPGMPPSSIASLEEYVPYRSRQLWWIVAERRPDPELHRLFQQIGCARFGAELMESWTDHLCGNSLVHSNCFEYIFFNEGFSHIPISC
jgi:hypothetical protein